MKKLLTFSLFVLPLVTQAAQAGTCADFKACATLMNELTGQRYVWDSRFEGVKFSAAPAVELTKENADLVFTALLDQAGFARAPVGDGKTFRIVKGSERKEMDMPVLEASATQIPNFPKDWDWVTMNYKLKSPELATYLERRFRLHVPRESRMQAMEHTGVLIVAAPSPVVRKMYETFKASDKPLTPALREEMAREKRQEEAQIRERRKKEGA